MRRGGVRARRLGLWIESDVWCLMSAVRSVGLESCVRGELFMHRFCIYSGTLNSFLRFVFIMRIIFKILYLSAHNFDVFEQKA